MRTRRRVQRRHRAQRRAECIGIVGLDRGGAARAEAEPGEDRLGERQRLGEAGDVVARLGAQQQTHRGRAIGKRGGDGFEADLRDLVDRKRQHVRGQAVAEARQRIDQRRAVRLVMHSTIARSPPASR